MDNRQKLRECLAQRDKDGIYRYAMSLSDELCGRVARSEVNEDERIPASASNGQNWAGGPNFWPEHIPENFIWRVSADTQLLVYNACFPGSDPIGAVQEVHCRRTDMSAYDVTIHRLVTRGAPHAGMIRIVLIEKGRETAMLDGCRVQYGDAFISGDLRIVDSIGTQAELFMF